MENQMEGQQKSMPKLVTILPIESFYVWMQSNAVMKIPRKKTASTEDIPSADEKVRVMLARSYTAPALHFALS